jgi:hypothetical protein
MVKKGWDPRRVDQADDPGGPGDSRPPRPVSTSFLAASTCLSPARPRPDRGGVELARRYEARGEGHGRHRRADAVRGADARRHERDGAGGTIWGTRSGTSFPPMR